MPELNHNILKRNIKSLMKYHNLTQAQLAEIAGMTQPNVSKALNGNSTFSLDQVFRIAQHFNTSIDLLTENKFVYNTTEGPLAVIKFLIKLLVSGKMRTTKITVNETWYTEEIVDGKYSNKYQQPVEVTYNAFYFQSLFSLDDFAFDDQGKEELHYKFIKNGNVSSFHYMNDQLEKILPIIPIYRNGGLEKDIFSGIMKKYIDELNSKLSTPSQE